MAHVKDIFSKHTKVPFLGSQLIRFTIDNIIPIYIALLVAFNVAVSIKNSLNWKEGIFAISNTLCRLDTEYLILHLDLLFNYSDWIPFLNMTYKKWFIYLGGGSFIAQLVSQMIVWCLKRILIAHPATVLEAGKLYTLIQNWNKIRLFQSKADWVYATLICTKYIFKTNHKKVHSP